jgi:hypothetical protein
MILPQLGGAAAAPGVMSTILGVYLVALVVETILALQMVPRPLATGAIVTSAIVTSESPSGAKAQGA